MSNGRYRISRKGLAALEDPALLDLAPAARLIAVKMLEVLTRDGPMSEDECITKALSELENAAQPPSKD